MSVLAAYFFKKENIIIELDKLEIEKSERDQLLKTIDEIVELRLIDLILERLEEKDKQLFVQQLHSGSAQVFADFLREKIHNVEEILAGRARDLESEILEDIGRLKKND